MDSLIRFKNEIEEDLLKNILPYWLNSTFDTKGGGFVGQVNSTNDKIWTAPKGGILNARILWAFSACYKKYKTEAFKDAAERAYAYLKNTFLDKEFGGIFWTVDSKGNPLDTRKHVYAQSFAIYGLTEFHSTFHNKEALDIANRIFLLIEEHCKDNEYRGYLEAFSREWKLEEDSRLSGKDQNTPKSMNTHLHVLEAYTNLYRYNPTSQIGEALIDLLDVFIGFIFDPKRNSLHNFLDEKWIPKSENVSFGHDIEASWLLLEASNVLGSYTREKELREKAILLAKAVLKDGVDKDFGIFSEGDNKDKEWWLQAEGMVGFLNAYQMTGNEDFILASKNIWALVKERFIDSVFGGWHEKISGSGAAYKLDKVREWKGPYHNSRAALEVVSRVEEIIRSKKLDNADEKGFKVYVG